jgi:hypothetical protein
VSALRRVGLLLLAGLALSGCTLVSTTPISTQPDGAIPFDLLAPTLPFSPSQRIVYTHRSVYFLTASGYLVPVARLVPAPASLASVLSQLPAGLTTAEAAQGLGTRVPSDSQLQSVQLEGTRLVVEVSAPFALVTGRSRTIAAAQLLLSAAAWGPVQSLSIEVDHEPLLVPERSLATTTVTLTEARTWLAPSSAT